MFFARALLVSASIAGLVVPSVLASPTANIAELDARANTAAVITNAKVTISHADDLLNKVAALKNANPVAAEPVVQNVKDLLNGGVFPRGGTLTSGGLFGSADALTGCLGGNTGSLGGLSGVLSGDGLKNLLNGGLSQLLNNLLGGLGLTPLLNSVGNLLNGLLGARGNCACGDGLDNLLQEVIDAVDKLLNSLGPVASASNGCGVCGPTPAVTSALQPLLSGLFVKLGGL